MTIHAFRIRPVNCFGEAAYAIEANHGGDWQPHRSATDNIYIYEHTSQAEAKLAFLEAGLRIAQRSNSRDYLRRLLAKAE